MQTNSSFQGYSYKRDIRNVGLLAQSKVKRTHIKGILLAILTVVEYFTYCVTFLLLMALRVIPEYSGVSEYNPINWYQNVEVFGAYMLLLIMILGIHAFSLLQEKLFSGKEESSFIDEVIFCTRSIIYAFLLSVGITFLLKTTTLYSRVTLVLFVILMIAESILWRIIHSIITSKLYAKGIISKRVLIVGAGKIGTDVQQTLMRTRTRKYEVIGFLDDYKIGESILGRTSDLEAIMEEQHADIVYITIPSERRTIESILHSVYKYHVDIRIIPEMFDRMTTVFTMRSDLEYPCMQIVKTPLRGLNVYLKRISDFLGSTLLLILLSPLFLVLAVLIKIDSKGEVFFKQQRVGKNGIPFNILKFRSMHQEAEIEKEQLAGNNESDGPVFKMKNDPRITKVGRILRKYSLDELPQLINVWRGEMSLIGPRPPLPSEVAMYSNYHWRRMDVLPGMTGLWQVSGRSDLAFDQWVDLDIYYIERWSIGLEMKILFKTIPAVIKGTGAY